MSKYFNFIEYYIISMRLHFGFITGMGGLLGISYYEFYSGIQLIWPIKIFAFLSLFFSYGINQIINDYTGIEEDKINAPNRPMVSGKLPAKPALFTSIILMGLIAVITLVIEPLALIPVVLGVLINYLYEYAKSYSILGNILFGLSMMSCPAYGFMIGGGINYQELPLLEIAIVIAFLSYTTGLMTYFTYFKDYEGDKLAGKKTYIVRHGVEVSKRHGVSYTLVPAIAFLLLIAMDVIPSDIIFNRHFMLIAVITFVLQIRTAILYFMHPNPPLAFYQQRENIQACVQSIILPIALFNSEMALMASMISYIGIEIIFNMHNDALA